jgi:hypothetical protein
MIIQQGAVASLATQLKHQLAMTIEVLLYSTALEEI